HWRRSKLKSCTIRERRRSDRGDAPRYAFAPTQRTPVGYLEELKRQAEATRAQNAPDVGALQRNTQLTEAACQSAFRYLAMLAQQLDVLQPPARSEYRLDSNTAFRNLRRTGFRADSRLRR